MDRAGGRDEIRFVYKTAATTRDMDCAESKTAEGPKKAHRGDCMRETKLLVTELPGLTVAARGMKRTAARVEARMTVYEAILEWA